MIETYALSSLPIDVPLVWNAPDRNVYLRSEVDMAMRQRITVIEDAREILTLFHDILTDEGYEVMPFTSPVPALEAMTRVRPDLIILDCIFNQAYSGRRVLHMLKTNLETAHIPIILCTAAMPLPDDVAAYIATHQVAFLPKPFSIDNLLDLVEQLTQRCS